VKDLKQEKPVKNDAEESAHYIDGSDGSGEPNDEQPRESVNKPKNPANNFLGFLIPAKDDVKGERIRKIALLSSVAAGLVIVCAVFIGGALNAKKDDDLNDALKVIKEQQTTPLQTTAGTEADEETPTPVITANYDILPQWKELYEQNNDLVGWVKIANDDKVLLEYPVVQRLTYNDNGELNGSNSYYLSHNFKGQKSDRGAIFADWHVPIESSDLPDNTVLYGHSMINDYGDGRYFAEVGRYFSQYYRQGERFKTYPTVTFENVYDNERATYKIFAGIMVNTTKDLGEVFYYHRYRVLDTEDLFYDFIGNVMDRSTFYTDVDVEYGDEILTLSTCCYPISGSTDTRYAVFARRVRPGEDVSVNTDAYYENPSPLYFDAWYKQRGGSWAGRNWDTSLVKGFDEYIKNKENN